MENKYRGLGLVEGEWKGKKEWYGGKIEFRAAARENDDGSFHLSLLQPEMPSRSRFFYRVVGSRRFIKLGTKSLDDQRSKHGSKDNRDAVFKLFLKKRFVLLGRIFVFMYAKDGTVFLYETDERFNGRPSNHHQGDQYRRSLQSLLEWYMPPNELNGNQVLLHSYQMLFVSDSLVGDG
jgi:hypothetical protein